MARRKKGRAIDGIVVIDKPAGLSSNKALQQIKQLYQAAKAGHTGSLDPLATGVLPLCFGEATKVSQYLLESDKAYRADIKLGEATTTADAEGEVIQTAPIPNLSDDQWRACFASFTGLIEQIPPAYSALKQNGVPLYKLARSGKEIIEKKRQITIYSIELVDWCPPVLSIDVVCSKGTYIRTLAEDIAKAVGSVGHICALRRTKAGPFSLIEAHSLDALLALADDPVALDNMLIAADKAIDTMPALSLAEDEAEKLMQGRVLQVSECLNTEAVRVYCAERFIGIGQVSAEGALKAVRLISYQGA